MRLLRAAQAELAVHARERETAYRWVDPGALARSLPGLADIGGPALAATMGDPSRFRTGKQFRSFTGLVPRADETGDTDRKGQTMSKAGSSLLRTTLVRAADTARKQDPQLARIYYVQMIERGKKHLGALCVVAANLAEWAWAVMNRGTPYVICDTHGTPLTANQAPPSSPSTGPCRPMSAAAGAARKGRPPKPSQRDDIDGATFPATHRRALTPTGSTHR